MITTDLSVCVVEKGPEVGAHILSGTKRGGGNQRTISSNATIVYFLGREVRATRLILAVWGIRYRVSSPARADEAARLPLADLRSPPWLAAGNVFEPRALEELFPDWKVRQPGSRVSLESDSVPHTYKLSLDESLYH
jgi:hypothetical protein